jgi:hypothetical protein
MAHDLGAIFLAVECRLLALHPGLVPLPEVQRLARKYCDDDTSIPAARLILERAHAEPHDPDTHDPREAEWMAHAQPSWTVERRCELLGRTALGILSTIGIEAARIKGERTPNG